MSSVLSAQTSASLVDTDCSSDHSDTPSKSFTRDSSSGSSSSSSAVTNHQGSSKSSAPTSPPRLLKSDLSPPPQPNVKTAVNGHTPEHEEKKRQVPSQSPRHDMPEQDKKREKDLGEKVKPGKEADRDDPSIVPGSDPDEDPDLGSGEGEGDWSQDEIEADIRRVKVCPEHSARFLNFGLSSAYTPGVRAHRSKVD